MNCCAYSCTQYGVGFSEASRFPFDSPPCLCLCPLCLDAHHVKHILLSYTETWKRRREFLTKTLGLTMKEVVTYNTILSCLFTAWSRVLENPTGFQLVNKFPAFYGTRRFITAFTRARHLFLSCFVLVAYLLLLLLLFLTQYCAGDKIENN